MVAIAIVTAAVTHYCTVHCFLHLKYRYFRHGHISEGILTDQSIRTQVGVLFNVLV